MNEQKQNCRVVKNRDRKPREKPKTLPEQLTTMRRSLISVLAELDRLLENENLIKNS